jgi:hypothetical protein
MVKNSNFNNITNSFQFLKSLREESKLLPKKKKKEKKSKHTKTLGLVGMSKGYKKASPFMLYLIL